MIGPCYAVQRRTSLLMLAVSVLAVTSTCLATNARCQSLDSILNAADKARLELSATRTAQEIRESQLTEKPKVPVIDFFRGSVGTSSRLGTLLADRFSESLNNFSRELTVLDRQLLKDYLRKEWTTLGDFHSNQAPLQLGRDLGATGVVTGGLVEENGRVVLKIHTEGFRALKKDPDSFNDTTEYVRPTATQELKDMLFQEGPNYARDLDRIPEERAFCGQASTEWVCPVVFTVRTRDPMLPRREISRRRCSLSRCYPPGKGGLDLCRERSAVWPDNKSNRGRAEFGN